jgi:formate-dependent nitrite reductase cytochrome c552 subunit
MKQAYLSRLTLVLGTILALCGGALAQDNSSASTQSNSASKKAPNAKPKKTWTDDDVASLHSPADSYRDQKQAQMQSAGDAKNPASAQETSASKELRDKPPLLSDPKTVESADKMIAWEDRDIAAQQEFVARLKTQLETAAPEDRDHLQELIVERQKIIADTRAERDGLVAKKKGLEKKTAATATANHADAVQRPQ